MNSALCCCLTGSWKRLQLIWREMVSGGLLVAATSSLEKTKWTAHLFMIEKKTEDFSLMQNSIKTFSFNHAKMQNLHYACQLRKLTYRIDNWQKYLESRSAFENKKIPLIVWAEYCYVINFFTCQLPVKRRDNIRWSLAKNLSTWNHNPGVNSTQAQKNKQQK